MSSSAATPPYVPVTFNPIECASRPLWVLHILPLPLPPLLARKWDYILKRFQVWYQDSDGDDITLGSSAELVSAVHELETERVAGVRFHFKKGPLVGQDLLFKMMDELDRVKIRYKVFGFIPGGSSIELDTKTKEIKSTPPYRNVREHDEFKEQAKLPEEEVDDRILNEPVSDGKGKFVIVGENVHIGGNVKVGTRDHEKVTDSVPEHNDLCATPNERSPAPSPRFEPFANNDTPLIDFGTTTAASLPEEDAPDPPDEAPSESSFPGSFPTGLDSGASTRQFTDWQSLISSTIQRALDQLARFGHITINAAQNSGFPVSNANSFDNARRTFDERTSSARAQLDNTSTNLRQNLARARMHLQAALDNARQQFNAARSGAQYNLSSGLVTAATNLANAGRQVEQAIARATTSLQSSGAVSQATADRVMRDLGSGAERLEHAMEDMTLRLQRLIDSCALGPQSPHFTSASNSVEEDIYGRAPGTLPGSFPVEPSGTDHEHKLRECVDRLVEMGFFSSDDRESAMAVAVATEGDLESAIDVMDGQHSHS